MTDWTKKPDETVFGGAGEQPDSQTAYERDVEIKRRLYLLEKEAVQSQIDATAAQREAIGEQQAAIKEMRWQSKMMLASVIVAFLAALTTLIAAFID